MKTGIAIALVLVGVAGVVGVVGCSSSEESDAREGTDAGASSIPEGGANADADATPDGGAIADAGSDARIIDPELEPVTCASEPCVVEIAAKSSVHICARRSDGSVGCWGNGSNGQLGANPSAPVPDGGAPFGTRPVVVADLPPAVAIAVGGSGYVNNGTGTNAMGLNGNSCALAAGGDVYCWGTKSSAFEGVSHPTPWVPAKMAFPPATHVALGNGIICVLDGAGVPICSGAPEGRDVLVPSSASTKGPRAIVTGGGPCAQLVGSARNVFCVEQSGDVYSWGFGRSLFPGEIQGDVEPSLSGRLSSLEHAPPSPVPTLKSVTSLSASWSTACALSQGGVLCWGRSDEGQLGTGGRMYQTEPQPIGVVSGDYVKQVSTGFGVTCALSNVGRVFCWGDNKRGQLGRGDILQSSSSVYVEGLPHVVQVAVLEASVCALAKNGEVWCWGSNDKGQLGRGSADTDPHPDPRAVMWGSAP